MKRSVLLAGLALALSLGPAFPLAADDSVKKEIKKDAKEVGHGTKKAAKEIGHATRDAAKEIGHGTRDAAKDAKKKLKKIFKKKSD